MFTEIGGLKIEYTVSGSGKQNVLLLHGWGASLDTYKGVISALSDRCRLYAVNFPGCGQSETMKSPWTLDDYCDFVKCFAENLNIEDPILIGHSHGGRVAMNLAAKKIMNPPKMVLLDAAGLIPKKSFKQKARAKSFKVIKNTLKIFGKAGEPLLQKARAHYGSADYLAAPPVLRQTLVNLVNLDIRDRLPYISCPTLLIWGDKDTATPIEDAKTIEKLIPDAGLCVLEGAGHFAFCERPYDTAAILRSFIK